MKRSFILVTFFCNMLLIGCVISNEAISPQNNTKYDWCNVSRQLQFGKEKREIGFLKIDNLFISKELFNNGDYWSLIGSKTGDCYPMFGITWIDAMWACDQITSNSVCNGMLLNDEIVRLPTRREIRLFSQITGTESKRHICDLCAAYSNNTHEIYEWTLDVEKQDSVNAYIWSWRMDFDGRLCNSVSLHLCHHAKKNLGFRIVVSEKSLVGEDSFLEYYRLSDQINNLQLMQRPFPSNHPEIIEQPAPMESNNDVSVDAGDL